MGSAARFSTLLVAGVAIVVLYVRSGESPVVLVLSLVTLVIGLYLWEAKPWAVASTEDGPEESVADRSSADVPSPSHRAPAGGRDDTWRGDHDLRWNERGITGVAVGQSAPRLVVWSRVDSIELGRHRPDAATDADADTNAADAAGGGAPAARRRAVRLGLYRPPGATTDTTTWLCLGADQDPERTTADLVTAWHEVRARRPYPEPERPTRERPGAPEHRNDPS